MMGGEAAPVANGSKAAMGGEIMGPTNPMVTPLLTDLYQYTMAYAYWKAGKHLDRAVYDFSSLHFLLIFFY
jgi:nicotinate phosphoribosyltransferase